MYVPPNCPPQHEWVKVLNNLRRGAAQDPDPKHQQWCKGQLKIFLKRYYQVAAAKGWQVNA